MVGIKGCKSYDREEVVRAVHEALELTGGISKYIKPGMKVAVKPNLVSKCKPERAATTHPEVVYAVCKEILDAGAAPIIVESPGGLYNSGVLKSLYNVCGISAVAQELGIEMNYSTETATVSCPDNIYLKNIDILKPLAECDAVVNLPKLKTHGMMVYTGAVKNLFGSIAGLDKAEYHFRSPDYDKFANTLIDIFRANKVCLNIMDGVYAMEGEGPTAGKSRFLGVILASDNAFDLDRIAIDIINVSYKKIPVLKNAVARGLCQENIKDVEVSGDDYRNFICKDFDVPQSKTLGAFKLFEGHGGALASRLKPKPVFNHSKCVSCGECAKCCPAKIISMDNESHKPVADLKKCISCFCCQELCPAKAVEVRRNIFMRIALGKKK